MSSHIHAETSSVTMHAGFPTSPEPTLGAPNLFIMNNFLQYICKCAQAHKSTIGEPMVCCAGPCPVYPLLCRQGLSRCRQFVPRRRWWSAQFCCVQQWKQAHCCKNHAHNPAQNAEQWGEHEHCTYWHPTQPHPDGVQATLQARMYDESQHSLPPMFWLVHHQIWTHFGRTLQIQLDGNCPNLTPLNGLEVLTSCIFPDVTFTRLSGTCYWWMCFHQPWVAVHVGESTCVSHWWLVSFELLSRFTTAYARIPVVS